MKKRRATDTAWQDLEEQGWLALERGEFEETLALARRVVGAAPREPAGHLLEGLARRGLGEPGPAVLALERAVLRSSGASEAGADQAEVLLEDLGDPERALAVCERELAKRPDPALKARLLHLSGGSLSEVGQPFAAWQRHEAAAALGPDLDEPEARGACLFALGALRRAAAAFRRALKDIGALSPDGHFLFAAALERLEDPEGARRHLAAARHMEPERFAAPVEIPSELLRARIEALLSELPAALREPAAAVRVLVERWPSPDDARDPRTPASPLVLGTLRGPTLHERDGGALLPSEIVVFQRNLELLCRNPEELDEQLQIALWRELGHYLGLAEDELAVQRGPGCAAAGGAEGAG